jgi:hypothetical protein
MNSGTQACDSRFVEVDLGLLGGSCQFWSLLLAPGCSFRLPGILGDEVDGARDNSSGGFFVVSLLGD